MSNKNVYLLSGTISLTIFSDGSSYYTPPAIPCWLPTHYFVGTTPNGMTIDLKTGKLTVTSNSI